ncbi:MAG: hypothetical protein HQK76_10575 [Desulfobacterales bacterium]|nr:hypothetical protein [Desulfobacterales bacterium]
MKKTIIIFITLLLGVLYNNCFAIEFDEMGKVDIHGFISQGYMKSNENNFLGKTEDGSFQFNEVGINFATDITYQLRLGLQIFSRDLGSLGNDELTIDWAFADYRWEDFLGARLGQMKLSHGLFNKTRDIDAVRTCILLPQSVYFETWRDILTSIRGIGIYGNISPEYIGDFAYQIQTGIAGLQPESSVIGTLEENIPFGTKIDVNDINEKGVYDASLAWNSPLKGLKLNQSYWYARFDTNSTFLNSLIFPQGFELPMDFALPFSVAGMPAGTIIPKGTMLPFDVTLYNAGADEKIKVKSKTYVTSVEYTWNNLVFISEYLLAEYYIKLGQLPAKEFTALGYYGMLNYRFTDWFEAGCYYSEYYLDRSDKNSKKAIKEAESVGKKLHDYEHWMKDFCLTLRFDLTYSWTVKLEGHVFNGVESSIDSENLDKNGDGYLDYEKNWFLFATKVSFNF